MASASSRDLPRAEPNHVRPKNRLPVSGSAGQRLRPQGCAPGYALRRPAWLVGSNAKLPVQSATLDRVLCLFGFPAYAEFARVLKPGGQLLLVDPGPDHLRELRQIIYPTLTPERHTDCVRLTLTAEFLPGAVRVCAQNAGRRVETPVLRLVDKLNRPLLTEGCADTAARD